MKYLVSFAFLSLLIFCKEGSTQGLSNPNEFSYGNVKVSVEPDFGSGDDFVKFLKLLEDKDCVKLKTLLAKEFIIEFNGFEIFEFSSKKDFKEENSNFSVCQVFFDTNAFRAKLVQNGMFPSIDVVDDNLLSVRDYISISKNINAAIDVESDGSKIKLIYFTRERGRGGIELLLSLYFICPNGVGQKCYMRKFSRS
ncbi:hypothetical protein EHR05_14760 [Leptospira licerasiae]|nr:hypothetical protein EHR05_14760 [Leptospira licerasiae]